MLKKNDLIAFCLCYRNTGFWALDHSWFGLNSHCLRLWLQTRSTVISGFNNQARTQSDSSPFLTCHVAEYCYHSRVLFLFIQTSPPLSQPFVYLKHFTNVSVCKGQSQEAHRCFYHLPFYGEDDKRDHWPGVILSLQNCVLKSHTQIIESAF